VFSCTVLFVSISQVISCDDRLRNDLYSVGWGVKLYSNQTKSLSLSVCFIMHPPHAAAAVLLLGTVPAGDISRQQRATSSIVAAARQRMRTVSRRQPTYEAVLVSEAAGRRRRCV